MKKEEYWSLFLATGSPEAYLLYNQAKRMENSYVPDHESTGASGDRLQ